MGHKYHKFYDQPKKSENSENKVDEVIDGQMTIEEVVEDVEEVNELIEDVEVLTEAEVEELNDEDVMDVAITSDGSLADGVVVNCTKLNMREEAKADSNVVCVINKGDKVTILLDESTEDFYRVSTKTTEGFCMKKFIEVK